MKDDSAYTDVLYHVAVFDFETGGDQFRNLSAMGDVVIFQLCPNKKQKVSKLWAINNVQGLDVINWCV